MMLQVNHLVRLNGSNMKVLGLLFTLVLVGCASNKVQVLRVSGNQYKAVVTATDRQEAEELGYAEAQKYCSKKGTEAIIGSRNSKYRGSMNETTRTTVRTASKVGAVVAAGAYVKGEKEFAEKAAAGAAGGLFTTSDRDYEIEVMFYCDEQLHDNPGSEESQRLW